MGGGPPIWNFTLRNEDSHPSGPVKGTRLRQAPATSEAKETCDHALRIKEEYYLDKAFNDALIDNTFDDQRARACIRVWTGRAGRA